MSLVEPGGPPAEVTIAQTWEGLKASPEAVLIDVRTEAEWSYVGVPSLNELGKVPVLMEWHAFGEPPDPRGFASILAARLQSLGVAKNAPLYFICRSGVRSRAAAQVMATAGYTQCLNVSAGFEGPLNGDRHRGGVEGWKAEGMPWTQS